MKLIIDISKDYYENIKHDVENHLTDYRPFEIIGNGTPFDSTVEYVKKSDLMDKVVMETLSDYTEHDVVHADDINSLPTYSFLERPKADVRENVRGEWIETEEGSIEHGKCSRCGWGANWYETDVFGMNFCPNCGADMR